MDLRTLTLALNTLRLAAAVCAVSVPLGTLLAWLLVRTDLLGRRLWLALLGLMLFVPLYLQAAAWQAGFGLQGWYTLAGFGPTLLEGWAGAIWIHAAAALPWVVLIVGFGLANVERELEESALLDASPRQVFWHVTLPRRTAGRRSRHPLDGADGGRRNDRHRPVRHSHLRRGGLHADGRRRSRRPPPCGCCPAWR